MPHSFATQREALLQPVHVFLYVLEVAPEARRALDRAGYTEAAHDRAWALFWTLNAIRAPGSTIAARARGWKPPAAALAALEELTSWFERWNGVAREAIREPIPRRLMRLDETEAREGAHAPSLRTPTTTATPVDATLFAALHGQPAPTSSAPVKLMTHRRPPAS